MNINHNHAKVSNDDIVRLYESGMTYRAIREQYGVTFYRLNKVLNARGAAIRHLKIDDKVAEEMRYWYENGGLSWRQIGDKMGYSATTVGNVLHRLGVTMRAPHTGFDRS